jgi:hypothetical protein
MDLTSAAWRRSSYTGSNGGNCVEVAFSLTAAVAVRDSKNPGAGTLVLTPAAWRALIDSIKAS